MNRAKTDRPESSEDFATLGAALTAFRRWQRRHGMLGEAVLELKHPAARERLETAIRRDGFAEPSAFLKAFEDILVLEEA